MGPPGKGGGKGEHQLILQQELTRVCTGRGLTPDLYCPVVTTSVKQMVTSLNFAGPGPDDLTAGCQQPFLVAYTGAEDHYRAMDAAMVVNQLAQGTANASLADIREIRDKEKVRIPRDLNQVSYSLQRFAVLVHALFQGPGTTNPFVASMWTLANTFNKRLPLFLGQHQALRGTPWYEVYPAHVLRHIQICVYEYLQGLQVAGDVAGGPTVPDFRGLLLTLQRGSFHMSAEWLPLPASVTIEPSTATMAHAGAASVATRTTRASTTSASVTSGLTTVTGGRTATNASTAASSYVANPTQRATLSLIPYSYARRCGSSCVHIHPQPTTQVMNSAFPGGVAGAAIRIAVERPRIAPLPVRANAPAYWLTCALTWLLRPQHLRHQQPTPDEEARWRRL